MAVGPSAAPIMPIEAAVFRSKPRSVATIIVANIPNCAAAPKNIMRGFLKRGPKSIIAPTAIKMRIGNNSFAIPAS